FVLGSCVTSDPQWYSNYRSLKPNMTEGQVHDLLGKPLHVKANNEWQYTWSIDSDIHLLNLRFQRGFLKTAIITQSEQGISTTNILF
ncbi:MAG: hypothetical protein OSA95_06425, partial [Opitutales bacterium]|nr:hypothetical protein [Opitutales bacterium]